MYWKEGGKDWGKFFSPHPSRSYFQDFSRSHERQDRKGEETIIHEAKGGRARGGKWHHCCCMVCFLQLQFRAGNEEEESFAAQARAAVRKLSQTFAHCEQSYSAPPAKQEEICCSLTPPPNKWVVLRWRGGGRGGLTVTLNFR